MKFYTKMFDLLMAILVGGALFSLSILFYNSTMFLGLPLSLVFAFAAIASFFWCLK